MNTIESITTQSIKDATQRYTSQFPNTKPVAKILTAHEQTWPDSTLGSGGIGMSVISVVPTVVVKIKQNVYVYHKSYQYDINMNTIDKTQVKNLKSFIKDQNLPGKEKMYLVGGRTNGRTYNEHQGFHSEGNFS